MAERVDPIAQDRLRAGAALKLLRKRSGKSAEAAALDAGIHPQTWRNYEKGARHMDPEMLARVTAAVGSSPEEHALEVARAGGPAFPGERAFIGGMAERRRDLVYPVGGIAHGGGPRPNVYQQGAEAEVIDFADFFTAGTRILRLDGMSMFPYAEPGGFVTYNPHRPARRGQGAVIQFKDGGYQVKRFERMRDDKVVVTELYPVEREIEYDLDDVEGVYAIGLRGD